MTGEVTRKANGSYQLWYTPGDTRQNCLSFFQTSESLPFCEVHLYEELGVLAKYARKTYWDLEATLRKAEDVSFKASRNKLIGFCGRLGCDTGKRRSGIRGSAEVLSSGE